MILNLSFEHKTMYFVQQAFEACCKTLSRSCYNRFLQNGILQSTQDDKNQLTRQVFDFVDVFFDEHDTFVPKS